jgi:hypothetical protein
MFAALLFPALLTERAAENVDPLAIAAGLACGALRWFTLVWIVAAIIIRRTAGTWRPSPSWRQRCAPSCSSG